MVEIIAKHYCGFYLDKKHNKSKNFTMPTFNKIKRQALDAEDVGLVSLEARVTALENATPEIDIEQLAEYIVSDEVVCDSANGTDVQFSLNYMPVAKSVRLELDGMDLTLGKDYDFATVSEAVNPQVVIFYQAPVAGSMITASYLKASLDD